ncbi:MAG: dephospho-CoA kinase [Candidatus Anammoxibacter sp.]
MAPKIIGIVGGIGSGKSTVARIMHILGAEVIDADKLCHKLLSNRTIKKKIVNIWPHVIESDLDNINRTKLAEIAFSKKENIEHLNKILHPIVIKQIKKRISGIKRKKKKNIIVIDAALLEESKLSSLCETIVFVDTKIELRVKRCKEIRNWDEDEIRKREQFQASIETKERRAQFTINNDDSKSSTIEQVNNIWNNFLNNT